MGEWLALAHHRERGLPVTVVRMFNTVGPRQSGRYGMVLPRFARQALHGEPITVYGDGSQTRAFCYVDDLIDGFLRFMSTPEEVTGPMNMGNPIEFTIGELAELVLEITGSKSKLVREPLPFDDPTQRCPDITYARDTLGWEPTITFDTWLADTVDWYREHADWCLSTASDDMRAFMERNYEHRT